jgi:NTE family protein
MAILASLQPNTGMVFPDSLRERLHSFAVLEGVNDVALKRLLAEADWFSLPGGTQLFHSGETGERAVFLVVTGSLGVFVEEEKGPQRLVAHIGAGETAGEMSALMGEAHVATLVALRDTELLRFGPGAFDKLLLHYPRVMFNLLKQIVRRLRQTTHFAAERPRPKTFALRIQGVHLPHPVCRHGEVAIAPPVEPRRP